MKPHEEEWHVSPCGNPAHGPTWGCWKVKDASGNIVLSSVTKAVADRHAAIPDMARALLAMLCDNKDCTRPECVAARSALTKAGVLP